MRDITKPGAIKDRISIRLISSDTYKETFNNLNDKGNNFLRNRNTFLEKREMSKTQNIDGSTACVLYMQNVDGKTGYDC